MSRQASISMVLARATASKSSAMASCGSIWMVYSLKVSPSDSMKRRLKPSQSKAGQADR